MIVGQRVTEDSVVLEWLSAELRSSRFYYPAIFGGRKTLDLVTDVDPTDEQDNRLRRALLTCVRGYEDRTRIFTGFPADVAWMEATLSDDDLSALVYLKDPEWVALTKGSRLVADGVRNLDGSKQEKDVRHAVGLYKARIRMARPIIVEHDGRLIVLDGCVRTTALLIIRTGSPIGVLLGRSAGFGSWYFV